MKAMNMCCDVWLNTAEYNASGFIWFEAACPNTMKRQAWVTMLPCLLLLSYYFRLVSSEVSSATLFLPVLCFKERIRRYSAHTQG